MSTTSLSIRQFKNLKSIEIGFIRMNFDRFKNFGKNFESNQSERWFSIS